MADGEGISNQCKSSLFTSYDDPFERVVTYLESSRIVETMHEVTWRIFYYQPEDPLDYITEYFQILMQNRETDKAATINS